mgnify:CR=1 FL=1
MNVKPPTDGFPHDIADVAGAVLGRSYGRDPMRAGRGHPRTLLGVYRRMEDPALYDEYRRRCFLLGQPLVVRQGASRVRARAVDLTPDFKLVIELPDKSRRRAPLRRGDQSAPPPPAPSAALSVFHVNICSCMV